MERDLDVEQDDAAQVVTGRYHLPFRVSGSGFRVSGSGFRVPDFGFRVESSGFRVPGSGLRVFGAGKRVNGSESSTKIVTSVKMSKRRDA